MVAWNARFLTASGLADSLYGGWNRGRTAADLNQAIQDASSITVAELHDAFDVCRANAALALAGEEQQIKYALARVWPD